MANPKRVGLGTSGAATMPPPRLPDVVSDERRNAQRFITVYRPAAVAGEAGAGLARILNISDGGMMLATSLPVGLGDRLRVALSESTALEGEVVWHQPQRCGIRLDQEICAADLLRSLRDEQSSATSRPLRLPLNSRARIVSEAGTHSVRIKDISQAGLKVSNPGSFFAGLKIKVCLPSGLERRGIVRWADGEHAGVMLHDPLRIDELGNLARL